MTGKLPMQAWGDQLPGLQAIPRNAACCCALNKGSSARGCEGLQRLVTS